MKEEPTVLLEYLERMYTLTLSKEKSLMCLCQSAAKPNYTRNANVNRSPQRLHLEIKFVDVLFLLYRTNVQK